MEAAVFGIRLGDQGNQDHQWAYVGADAEDPVFLNILAVIARRNLPVLLLILELLLIIVHLLILLILLPVSGVRAGRGAIGYAAGKAVAAVRADVSALRELRAAVGAKRHGVIASFTILYMRRAFPRRVYHSIVLFTALCKT